MKVKDLIKILEDFNPLADVTIHNEHNPMKPENVIKVEKTNRIFAHEDESQEIAILKTF